METNRRSGPAGPARPEDRLPLGLGEHPLRVERAAAGHLAAGDGRAERLGAAGRDLLERRARRLVALNEGVVVAERHVARNVEAGGVEGLLRLVEEAGVGGEAGERAADVVGVVEVGGGAGRGIVVVLDAGVARGLGGAGDADRRAERVRVAGRVDAAVGIEAPAVEQRPDPARLVELLAVGGVAGVDHEVHRHLGLFLARTGPASAKALTWRIIESSICGFIASHGRHAASSGGPIGSTDSTRAGLSSSASWKSESWPM